MFHVTMSADEAYAFGRNVPDGRSVVSIHSRSGDSLTVHGDLGSLSLLAHELNRQLRKLELERRPPVDTDDSPGLHVCAGCHAHVYDLDAHDGGADTDGDEVWFCAACCPSCQVSES